MFSVPPPADEGVAGRKRISHRDEFDTRGTIPTNAAVRGLLHFMQAHICVYCGLEDRTLDVEHFLPKGAIHAEPDADGYWWLAYEAANETQRRNCLRM